MLSHTTCALAVDTLSAKADEFWSPDCAHYSSKMRARLPPRGLAYCTCDGPFKDKKPTTEQISKAVQQHSQWVHSGGQANDSRRANFCRANLQDIELHADLRGAIFTNSTLTRANLSDSDFFGANFTGATLLGTRFNDANLQNANLSQAALVETDLSGALLLAANLEDVDFEPRELPSVSEIAFARNLSTMNPGPRSEAMYKLRKAFKDAGYYDQEKALTYAINHARISNMLNIHNYINHTGVFTSLGRFLRGLAQYILFEFTTKWGMRPGRALTILLGMIPVFAVFYTIGLLYSGHDGIWRKWADDRMRSDIGTEKGELLHVGWQKASLIGVQFSVQSAFSVGWREINIGDWIQRFQTKEYKLVATGWTRAVSGAQSLLSVYLVAIWALTEFGRPFE